MKITIVNYEQGIGINGILTKYAKEMEKALIDLGHDVEIASKPQKADINHHINYYAYIPSGGKDTTMITHITSDMYDRKNKIEKIKSSLKTSTGICFDNRMKEELIKEGCDEKKLEVVAPAHDDLNVRPRIIAIATNIYPDGRKREEMFSRLIYSLKDQKKYTFRIMGKGWKPVLDKLVKNIKGFQVQWLEEFNGDFYNELLNTSDYMLYTGKEDALAQSLIDAKHCYLKIIAPPQDGLQVEFPFVDQKTLNKIFENMLYNPVKDWTWENYCKNHIKIWKKLS